MLQGIDMFLIDLYINNVFLNYSSHFFTSLENTFFWGNKCFIFFVLPDLPAKNLKIAFRAWMDRDVKT